MIILLERKSRLFDGATHAVKLDEENQIAFELQDGAGKPIAKVLDITYTAPEVVKKMFDELIKYLNGIGASQICIAYRMQNQEELIPLLIDFGFNGEWHLGKSVYMEMLLTKGE